MVTLAATDESGRYRLENIPPGRYYISAGRVDFPTYYRYALARGTIIAIAPKAVVEGIDFAMVDSSARVADPLPAGNLALSFALPLQVKVEGGGKLPVFSPNGFLVIRMTNTSNGARTEIPINASMIPVPNATAEFQISVENLPAGYAVKSIMTGTRNPERDAEGVGAHVRPIDWAGRADDRIVDSGSHADGPGRARRTACDLRSTSRRTIR
jgi:hypothetical protein